MMPKHTGEPDLALVGLALLIILAFMMWQDRPIQSPRPYDSTSKHSQAPRVSDNSYESWLWQDPFEFDPGEDELHDKLHEAFNLSGSTGKSRPLAEKSEKNNDLCYCKNGLLTRAISELTENQGKTPIKILLPSVEIRPNTVEKKEFRTRYRYAVVSGLIAAGYRPSKPNRINFCASQKINGKSQYDIRWEHFERNGNDNLLVIWGIDKDTFETKITSSMLMKIELPDLKPPENSENSLIDLLKKELVTHRKMLPSEIAIISEYDTESFQKLTNDLKDSIKEQCSEDKNSKNECDSDISNYTYFKGLDAYQRQLGKQGQEGISKTVEKREEILSIMDQHNLPIGPAQFDYLYRLTRQIKESHKDTDHKKHIKAVGVFGSDFYDKLVIFEALRAEIPNIVLFTTDLDAEMLHPQYWRWTRNLIVATPFDLRLNEEFQKQIPPFRDSLQTEIYYRTFYKLISDSEDKEINLKKASRESLIFEIGRYGPVYLYGYQKESVHPDYTGPQKRLKNQLILWFLIAIALIFTVQQIKPHSGAIVVWLLATTVCFFVLAFYAINLADEEPFSFTDGVSMWPSILLRWLTFSLVIAFIYSTIRSLEANFDRLNRRYFSDLGNLNTLFKDEKPLTVSEIFDWKNEHSTEPKKRLEASIALFIIFIIVLIYAYAIDTNNLPQAIVLMGIITFSILMIICFPIGILSLIIPFSIPVIAYAILSVINETVSILETILMTLIISVLILGKEIKSIQTLIEKDILRPQVTCSTADNKGELNGNYPRAVISSKDLWQEYYDHGRFRHRLLRASLKFCIFMIVAALLYQLFPVLPPPCRGDSCIFWEETSRVLSFSIIMLSTFLVLDAQRLCLHWIEKIRTKHPLLANRTFENEENLDYLLTETDSSYELDEWYKKLKSLNYTNVYRAKKSIEELETSFAALKRENNNLEKLTVLEKLHGKLETIKAKVLPIYEQDNPAAALKSLQDIVTLVAKRTRVVDQLIYYPLIAIMLLLIARMSYFDNIAFPLHVGFTVILSISLLLYAGAKLRIEAVQLKRTAINAIKNLPHSGKETVIREIQEIDYGAFEPLFEQPAIRSLLLTLGFLGLIIGEYFKLFG
ncbi:hypothetical protein [Nitrosomonas sp. sh817]|uniref:hypothetical protein n=1 Tax=Nitrosomonas sp. sh817 TaxID=3070658 RepID=UPI0027DCCBD3|nr:hypothetical protein [Nitrosomonas sp. sh817]WMJ09271.1 hypothetical protein RBH92_03500 [Nitrosomonas sp. sh817]